MILMPNEGSHSLQQRSSPGTFKSCLGYTIQRHDLGEQSSQKSKGVLACVEIICLISSGSYMYVNSFLERGPVVFMIFSDGLITSKKLRSIIVEFDCCIWVTLQAFNCEVRCAEEDGFYSC